jgi:hypothetical protein
VDFDLGSSAGGKAMSNVTTKVKEAHRKNKAEEKRLRKLERRNAKREQKQPTASN